MKKAIFLFLLLIISCQLLAVQVFAAPTATPTTASGGPVETCDLCGKCGDQIPSDWNECNKCIKKEDYSWTVLGCLPSSPGGFTQAILRVFTSIVGGIAFLAFLYGGALILTSAGNPEKLNTGKSILLSAIVGILVVIFAVFILRFIGVEIFELPGFGG